MSQLSWGAPKHSQTGAPKLLHRSPSTSLSPSTTTNTTPNLTSSASLQKIVIAQIFLLLSQFGAKDEKERAKDRVEQIQKVASTPVYTATSTA